MRHLVLAMLVLVALLTAGAQEQQTLSLSACPVVIKITDAEKQLTNFAPLFALFDEFGKTSPVKPPQPAITPQQLVTYLKQLPGINLKGNLWIVIPQPKPTPVAALDKDDAAAPAPKRAETDTYIILTVTDPEMFSIFLQGQNNLRGRVIGDYAIVTSGETKLPKFTDLKMDLPLASKRDVVLSFQMSIMDKILTAAGMDAAGPMAAMLAPVLEVINELETNLHRLELGLAMQGEDFSAETFAVPVPNSPFAKSLATTKPSPIALEYAGYLPENMAYLATSGPAISGAPSVRMLALRVMVGLLSMFLPPERQQPTLDSMSTLITTCSQGRAIGVVAPPADKPGGATVVGIYHVANVQEAQAAIQGFVKEVMLTREAVGGQAAFFSLELQPGAEKIGETPIDLLTLSLTPPAAAGKDGAKPQAFALPCRLAYVGDKLLITGGDDSSAQMTKLLERVQQKKAAFTAGARYKALAKVVPEGAYGFEAYSMLDLARVVVNLNTNPKEKAEGLKWLSLFPPQRTAIATYQEVKDGALRTELRLPAEQTNFVYTIMKAMQEISGAKPDGQAPAPPQPGAEEHED